MPEIKTVANGMKSRRDLQLAGDGDKARTSER